MYFCTSNSPNQSVQNMKEGSFISVQQLPTQILGDLEAKSKPSNNRQLQIIHPEFPTFHSSNVSDSTIIYFSDLKKIYNIYTCHSVKYVCF